MARAKPSFSKPVLQALQAKGYTLSRIRRATRASAELLIEVLDGHREFSDAHIDRIEKLTGLTGAQLAASMLEPGGGPLTQLSELWAVSHRTNVRRTRARRKPSKRALVASH